MKQSLVQLGLNQFLQNNSKTRNPRSVTTENASVFFFLIRLLDSTEEYYQIISEAKVVVVQSNGTPMPSED